MGRVLNILFLILLTNLRILRENVKMCCFIFALPHDGEIKLYIIICNASHEAYVQMGGTITYDAVININCD